MEVVVSTWCFKSHCIEIDSFHFFRVELKVITINRIFLCCQYKTNKHVTAAGGTPTKINVCANCKKTHDQHLLAHCDTCKLHYHLSCLTPPLTRMPKKSKLYGWSCSECYPHSSSDEEVYNEADQESVDDATKKRNRSRRLAASKALVANSDFDWPTQNSWHAYRLLVCIVFVGTFTAFTDI